MTILDPQDQKRVRFHLSYTSAAVPDGDQYLLETRMQNIPDLFTVGKIREHLDRCDRAFDKSEMDQQVAALLATDTYAGDINRTNVKQATESLKTRRQNYLFETNMLALRIGAPNYTDPDWWGNLYMRHQGGTLPRIPAPADTTYQLALGTDVYLYFG